MVRTTLLLLAVLQFTTGVTTCYAQEIARFAFNETPYLAPQVTEPDVSVTDLNLSTGTISTKQTTGTYFADEPYIASSGGWTATDARSAKQFQFIITPTNNKAIQLTNFSAELYATSSGPSRVSILVNDSVYSTLDIGSARLVPLEISIQHTIDSPCTIALAAWQGERTTTGGGSLRLDNIVLDGFVVPLIDITPPQLDSLVVHSKNQLYLYYSEELANTSLKTVNFHITNNSLDTVRFLDDTHHNIALESTKPFSEGLNTTLHIETIADLAGNTTGSAGYIFRYINTDYLLFEAEWGDVLITEIMFDINPAPAHLPAAKYIELYNRRDYPIRLDNWQVTRDNYTANLNGTLPPQSYVILCNGADALALQPYGTTIDCLPSSLVSASGGLLRLISPKGKLIFETVYDTRNWSDREKAAGGWSAERLNTSDLCTNLANWVASESYLGGTPGQPNATLAQLPELQPPKLLRNTCLAANIIQLDFDTEINDTSLDPSNFLSSHTPTEPIRVQYAKASSKSLTVQFVQNFPTNETISLFADEITDRCGHDTNYKIDFTYKPLHLERYSVHSPNWIEISFSEATQTEALVPESFILHPNNQKPTYVLSDPHSPNLVHLNFASDFEQDRPYTLTWCNLLDAQGVETACDSLQFIVHDVIANDLVINEVITYPNVGGIRFVELYNRSEYPIDLSSLYFQFTETNNQTATYALAAQTTFLAQGGYLALTEDTSILRLAYSIPDKAELLQVADLPTYDKASAEIILVDEQGKTIDAFSYNSNYHFSLFTDYARGVALERVDPNKPTNDVGNWQSAAETWGYATPGYANSQYVNTHFTGASPSEGFTLDQQLFTPNNDGLQDRLLLQYNLPNSSNIANVRVFDTQGRLVKTIASNLLLAKQGSLTWDGANELGALSPIGIYVVLVEYIDAENTVHEQKFIGVLGAMFTR